MRIKLDENLPASVASALTALAHELHTVAEENLSGSKDHELWEAAQQEPLFLITQDLDFSDTRKFAPEHTLASCWFVYPRRTGAH